MLSKAMIAFLSGISLYLTVGMADGSYDRTDTDIVPMDALMGAEAEYLPAMERQTGEREVSFRRCARDWNESPATFTDSAKMPLHHHLATRHTGGIRSLAAAMGVVGCASQNEMNDLLPAQVDTVIDRTSQALRLPAAAPEERS